MFLFTYIFLVFLGQEGEWMVRGEVRRPFPPPIPSVCKLSCTDVCRPPACSPAAFMHACSRLHTHSAGLEIKLFFQGAHLHLQKLTKGVLYRKQYIFGLPSEILESRRRNQGSPGLLAPPNFEPCSYCLSTQLAATAARDFSQNSRQQHSNSSSTHQANLNLTLMLMVATLAYTKRGKNPNKWNWNPGKWVLIWEYLVRVFQWIPIWQGLYGFHKSLRPCALDENSLSIGRVNHIASSYQVKDRKATTTTTAIQ